MVKEALLSAGLAFQEDGTKGVDTLGLDFKVGDIYIEVKQRHSPRISGQMARADNIIALQGAKAVDMFCKLLRGAA
jgi:hypothetical protein